MADTKISALAAVTDLQDTDELVMARAGDNKKIDAVDLKAAIVDTLRKDFGNAFLVGGM